MTKHLRWFAFCFAGLLLLVVADVSSAERNSRPQKEPRSFAISCGTRQEVFRTSYARQSNELVYTVEFDAVGGGTVWWVVPPEMVSAPIPVDNVVRHYVRTATIYPSAGNPIPLQLLGVADAYPCTTGLTVSNITWRVGP